MYTTIIQSSKQLFKVLKVQTIVQSSKVLKFNRLPWCSHPHTDRPALGFFEVGLIKVKLPNGFASTLFLNIFEAVLDNFSLDLPGPLIIKQLNNVGVAFLDLIPILKELVPACLISELSTFCFS